ncbi:MAG: GTPase HflX [Sediminispirochaetaceae bacterium]
MLKNTALLVTLKTPDIEEKLCGHYLSELRSLCDTLGIDSLDQIVVPVRQLHPRFLVGSGKAEEICRRAEELEADCIIFDDTISPSQQRNLEHISGRCVIDRQEVILEIFSEHARTREAMLQVGLARMEYSLPRLKRAWTHLSRQRGGMRGTRGEGETQLEVDRRIVLKKITRLKADLKKLEAQRSTRRKQRTGIPVPTGAIVGYTNAGKSSLLNAMTGSKVGVENQLFATLDPTTRKMELQGGTRILLTDTVGFIRKLPHSLVNAFHSTLEEAVVADFLLHVLDASNPEVEHHLETTNEVLAELETEDIPALLVFNKIDVCDDEYQLEHLRRTYPDALFVSIKTGAGIGEVAASIERLLFEVVPRVRFHFPISRYDLAAEVHRSGTVIDETYEDSYVSIEARVPVQLKKKLSGYIAV